MRRASDPRYRYTSLKIGKNIWSRVKHIMVEEDMEFWLIVEEALLLWLKNYELEKQRERDQYNHPALSAKSE